jgi:hypothetical protein
MTAGALAADAGALLGVARLGIANRGSARPSRTVTRSNGTAWAVSAAANSPKVKPTNPIIARMAVELILDWGVCATRSPATPQDRNRSRFCCISAPAGENHTAWQ